MLPLGVQIEPMEGNWKPNRTVLIEFEAAEQAKRWSPAEYGEARAIHHQATNSTIILTDGASCEPM